MGRNTNSRFLLILATVAMSTGCSDPQGRRAGSGHRINPTPTTDVDLDPVAAYLAHGAQPVPGEVVGEETGDDMGGDTDGSGDSMGGDPDSGSDSGMDPWDPSGTSGPDDGGSSGGMGDSGQGDPMDPPCDGFSCDSGLCIDAQWVCDGFEDCATGEDEAMCAQAEGGVGSFSLPNRTQSLDLVCVSVLGEAGKELGGYVGESATKMCKRVGARIPGKGFAAAVVCHAADWAGADQIAGALAGKLAGWTTGAVICEGGLRDQVYAAWNWLWGNGQVETFDIDETYEGDPLIPPRATEPEPFDGPICEGSYDAAAHFSDSACGVEPSHSLECWDFQTCDDLLARANRNRLCQKARIVSANSDYDGEPPEFLLELADRYEAQFHECDGLLQGLECEQRSQVLSDAAAEQAALDLICG